MAQLNLFGEAFQNVALGDIKFLQINAKEVNNEVNETNSWKKNLDSLSCLYCQVEFENVLQQKEHYKLDWHRYNIKQKLLSRSPLSEEEFNSKADDVSSISASSSEEEDNFESYAATQGKIFLQNQSGQVFSLYRNILLDKKANFEEFDVSKLLQNCIKNSQWTIIMLGGGHFAAAVFQNNVPILHKTFHCYTVRAGQGGSQSARDTRSNTAPKSAGASLRRYNEMALAQHVRDIMKSWNEQLMASNLIFYRASGPQNQSVLFGGKDPILNRLDNRLRTIPFSTRRATFTELQRTYVCLTSVNIYDSMEDVVCKFMKENVDIGGKQKKNIKINRSKSREIKDRQLPVPIISSSSSTSSDDNEMSYTIELSNEQETIDFQETLESFGDSLTPEQRKRNKKKVRKPAKSRNRRLKEYEALRKKQICDVVKSGDLNNLVSILSTFEVQSGPVNDKNEHNVSVQPSTTEKLDIMNEILDNEGNTILHLAAFHEFPTIVEYLLERDSNPCNRNKNHKTPYCVTQNSEIRDIFKNFARTFPEKYNYNKANIPVNTLTLEEQTEKKNLQKQIKKEKEKQRRKNIFEKKQEESEKQRFINLSDREKRALAAERRILNQSGSVISRCFLCAADITGKVPFEYSGNRFCTMECLKAHRLQTVTLLK